MRVIHVETVLIMPKRGLPRNNPPVPTLANILANALADRGRKVGPVLKKS